MDRGDDLPGVDQQRLRRSCRRSLGASRLCLTCLYNLELFPQIVQSNRDGFWRNLLLGDLDFDASLLRFQVQERHAPLVIVIQHHRKELQAGLVEVGEAHGEPGCLTRSRQRIVHANDLALPSKQTESVADPQFELQK